MKSGPAKDNGIPRQELPRDSVQTGMLHMLTRIVPPIQRLLQHRDELVTDLDLARRRLRKVQAARKREARRADENERQLAEAKGGPRNDAGDGNRSLAFLFIVTYGRSGSTLLQGILSSIPGYFIRGENGGALYHLYQFHKTVVSRKSDVRRSHETLTVRHPWFGLDDYPEQVALSELRGLVLDTLIRPSPDARVVGFKEIRWQYADLTEYLDFLSSVFPGARFVFNTRAHADVAKSQWWAKKEDPWEQLERAERQQHEAAMHVGERGFSVHYDDYVADPGQLRGLFEWLGEEFDVAAVNAVMTQRHSY